MSHDAQQMQQRMAKLGLVSVVGMWFWSAVRWITSYSSIIRTTTHLRDPEYLTMLMIPHILYGALLLERNHANHIIKRKQNYCNSRLTLFIF
jgi:hypothetical protein